MAFFSKVLKAIFFISLVFSAAARHAPTSLRLRGGDGRQPYEAIYSFGDSLTDTGNLIRQGLSGGFGTIGNSPYGESMGGATGRCSDGRLMIDFISDYLHLPSPPPRHRHPTPPSKPCRRRRRAAAGVDRPGHPLPPSPFFFPILPPFSPSPPPCFFHCSRLAAAGRDLLPSLPRPFAPCFPHLLPLLHPNQTLAHFHSTRPPPPPPVVLNPIPASTHSPQPHLPPL